MSLDFRLVTLLYACLFQGYCCFGRHPSHCGHVVLAAAVAYRAHRAAPPFVNQEPLPIPLVKFFL
jgi:hypothetical protein